MIRLVVTDLDGTLWLGDGAVSDATRAAIGELARRDQGNERVKNRQAAAVGRHDVRVARRSGGR